jgi:hypothetical protein
MKLLNATLAENPKAITTKYGDKTVADVITETGETVAVWRPANDSTLMGLRRGDRVTIAKDSKGKISLIDNAASPSTTTQPTQPATQTQSPQTGGMTPETKKAIAAYVEEMGSLYSFCYTTAAAKLAEAPNEAKQAMASSLFIAAQRKFNLA